MKAILTLAIFLTCLLPAKAGNEDADFQIRAFSHLQYLPGLRLNDDLQLGLAGWWIIRDITDENYSLANTAVAGPMLIDKDGNWVELMFGRFKGKTKSDFVIDVRTYEQICPQLSVTGEIAYFPSEETERLYFFLVAETPVKVGGYTMRVGFESENIVSLCGKKDLFGIGPRVSFPLPVKGVPGLNATLSIGYEFRNDRDFLRCYVGFNYRF